MIFVMILTRHQCPDPGDPGLLPAPRFRTNLTSRSVDTLIMLTILICGAVVLQANF
jgi:hypothetical protein